MIPVATVVIYSTPSTHTNKPVLLPAGSDLLLRIWPNLSQKSCLLLIAFWLYGTTIALAFPSQLLSVEKLKPEDGSFCNSACKELILQINNSLIASSHTSVPIGNHWITRCWCPITIRQRLWSTRFNREVTGFSLVWIENVLCFLCVWYIERTQTSKEW